MAFNVSQLVSIAFCALFVSAISAFRRYDVARATYEGVLTYHSVNSTIIQKRLDEFYETNNMRLFLPEKDVFPGVLEKGKHVVFLDFGEIGFSDYENYDDPRSNLSVHTPMVSLTIPLLADHPKSPPKYDLAIGKIYQRSSKEFANPNFAFPVIPIDELTITSDMAVLRNGSDEMFVSIEIHDDPCEPQTSLVRYEFDDLLVEGSFHIGLAKPSFKICDRYPDDNRFCDFVEEHREDVSCFGSNFCQSPWTSQDLVSCRGSARIVNITTGFREMMFLEDQTSNFFATEYISGNFTVGIKYPCIV